MILLFFILLYHHANTQNSNLYYQYPNLKNTNYSIVVYNLNKKKLIVDINSELLLRPASTLKLFSTAASLIHFGPQKTFLTKFYYSGTIENKKLKGNIYIKGGGDPTFLSSHFSDSLSFLDSIVLILKKLNIDTIEGNIITDGSYFSYDIPSPYWLYEDIGNYYGACPTGLCFLDNSYEVFFKTLKAGQTTKIIKIFPPTLNLLITNKVLSAAIKSDKAYIYGSPYSNVRLIKGYLPQNQDSFSIKGSLPDPELNFSEFLIWYLSNKNIFVKGHALNKRIINDSINYSKLNLLIEKKSKCLEEIIKVTNKKSVNLYADALLLHLSKELYKIDDIEEAGESLKKFWSEKGMDTTNFDIYDGSGLSPLNFIKPKQVLWLLDYMYQSQYFEYFLNSLSIAGIDGTLKNFGNEKIKNKVFAKTGSIKKVRNYAGYVIANSGDTLAFVLFINNYNTSTNKIKDTALKILTDVVIKN